MNQDDQSENQFENQFEPHSHPLLQQYCFGSEEHIPEQPQYINQYYTQRDHLQQQLTKQEEKITKALREVYDTKNIPKTIGNYFRKYLLTLNLDINNPNDLKLLNFVNKKKKGSQSAYGIEDIKGIFIDKKGNQVFSHFIENIFLINMLQSNRIEDISKYLMFIEQYASGVKNPEKFISSRHHSQIEKKVKLNNDKE